MKSHSYKPVCHLVHGAFDAGQGRNSILRLRPMIEAKGWTVKNFTYTSSASVWTWWTTRSLAAQLMSQIGPNDCVVAQCFGVTLTYLAIKWGACVDKAIFINPNLDRNATFNGNVKKVYIWYVPNDPVLIGGSLAPFHPMGLMGTLGYSGKDERVESNIIEVEPGMRKHSALFDHQQLFLQYIPQILEPIYDYSWIDKLSSPSTKKPEG